MRINTPPVNDVMQVLVLDDELPVARAVRRQLQEMSCQVSIASTVEEAETQEAAQQFDVALIDHNLAGSAISGLAYLTRLQERNPYCYRIIFTGEAEFAFAVEAINRGHIDAFLPKPWSEEQLRILVHQGAQTAWLRQHNALLNEHLADQNEQLNRFNAQLEELVLERTRKLEEMNRRLELANRELKTYQDELVRLETQAAISQLVQGLAHELNNPLAVILGYAQRYARRYNDDERLAKCFRIIREEGKRSQHLIGKLRHFIQRESDPPQAVHLERLINMACDRLLERGADPLP
ncbi:MAG: response regulator, partial [Planctomycetota bacterium]